MSARRINGLHGSYQLLGPVAYLGKRGCTDPTCRQQILGRDENGDLIFGESCFGYHCAYCDEPCSMMGHRCDAGDAILGEARRIADEGLTA